MAKKTRKGNVLQKQANTRFKTVLACILLLLIALIAFWWYDLSPKSRPMNLKSQPIKIEISRPIYTESPPNGIVEFEVEIENISGKDINYFEFQENCFGYYYVNFEVYLLGGKPREMISVERPDCPILSFTGTASVLKPGGKIYKRLAVNDFLPPKNLLENRTIRPGKYSLRAVFDSSNLDGFDSKYKITSERIYSNELEFTVRQA